MTLTIDLNVNNNILAALDSRQYLKSMMGLISQINDKKICYVSLNKPFNMINNNLRQNGIDTQRFFFIDGVTRTTIPEVKPLSNCDFVSAPNALTEIGIAIGKRLSSPDTTILLFDSVSTLLIYEKENTVIEFVHSIINNVNAAGKKGVFACLSSDISKQFTHYLYMFFDQVLEEKET